MQSLEWLFHGAWANDRTSLNFVVQVYTREFTYQCGIDVVRVVHRIWRINSQRDTVSEYCNQYKNFERSECIQLKRKIIQYLLLIITVINITMRCFTVVSWWRKTSVLAPLQWWQHNIYGSCSRHLVGIVCCYSVTYVVNLTASGIDGLRITTAQEFRSKLVKLGNWNAETEKS